ncbi:uncharacterized protein DNG_06559 [Cephalotrichum gorgonifer]|uniref:Uncharacterized protein n=1 Tax=Cephalotrichum gorgonifer TaxID=2041049 RepID=A0AAE8MZV9_9PEZI|nr:uncharacterized protein DNG_06559 [Cephalotrichum gorgonifer]
MSRPGLTLATTTLSAPGRPRYLTSARDDDTDSKTKSPGPKEEKDAETDPHDLFADPLPGVAPHPPSRGPRWRHSHGRIEIETPSLGMKILGKDGHTIVLRERASSRKDPTIVEEQRRVKDLDIERTLEEQDQDLTIEETMRNIEELRPSDSSDLLARQFSRILTTLMDGFTRSQLEDYVCHFMGGVKGGGDAVPDRGRSDLLRRLTGHMRAQLRYPVRPQYQWIRKQFAWMPPKDYPWGNTMKEKLALAIMRACWHLQAVEETPLTGEVEISADQRILNLLLGESRALNSIRSTLGDGAGIRIFPEKEKIQIMATRSKCDTVLGQLDRFVARIQESTTPLSALGPRRLSDEDLRQLSTLTNTCIEYTGSKSTSAKHRGKRGEEIRVSWLPAENRPDTVESLQHIVFRLLLSATTPADGRRTVKLVLDKANNVSQKDLVLVRQYGDNHELSWDLRYQSWGRLMCPAQPKPVQVQPGQSKLSGGTSTSEVLPSQSDAADSESNEVETPELASEANTTAQTVPTQSSEQDATISPSALHLPLVRHDTDPAPEGWSALITRTSATFGHLLHPFPSTAQYEPWGKETPAKLKPVAPPISALASIPATGADEAAASTTLLLRFRPSEGPAPPLEFHLRVPDQHDGPLRWDQTEKKLFALRYTWTADVLLPLLPVDVSIQQSLVSQMDASTLDSCSSLRAFFEGADLDLSRNLLTPPSFSLPLHPSLLRREGGGEAGGDGEVEVQYLFTGLELHTSSSAPFHAHSLSYTSIEGGQQGRRAQLSLHPLATAITPDASIKDMAGGYLDEVLRIASGRYFSWVGSRPLDLSPDDS